MTIAGVSKMTGHDGSGRGRKNPPLVLVDEHRQTLERWVRARTTPQRVVLRSAIVLLAAEQLPVTAIAKRLNTSRSTVHLWCRRFEVGGPASLLRDAPGRGRKSRLTAAAVMAVVNDSEGKRVSIRQLAQRLDTSASAVHRALKAQQAQRQFRDNDNEE